MNPIESVDELRPADIPLPEWRMRLELAACYRLMDWMGWAELIFNHVTLRVPGPAGQAPSYLINPFGLHYAEVTARNLVRIDIHGNKVVDSPYPVNPAGFVIHSAIHGARHDAHCVIHTHTTAGMAIACKEGGLRHDNFYSATLYGRVAYHDFEGITTDLGEQPRLVASLGDKEVLILRNHGLLVTAEHIPAAFQLVWTLQRACEIQALADSMVGANIPVSQDVLSRVPAQADRMQVTPVRPGQLVFDAMLRRAGIRYADLAQ